MARINLLPWRESLRKEKQKEFFSTAALGVLLMLAIVFYVHLHVGEKISAQQSRNDFLQQQIAAVDRDLEEIKKLESEKKNLLARMEVIQELQRSRPSIIYLFDELVAAIPEGIYFTNLSRENNLVIIEGRAQSNARVSNFMRNLDASPWFNDPRLIVIDSSSKSQGIGSTFTLQVKQVDMVDEVQGGKQS